MNLSSFFKINACSKYELLTKITLGLQSDKIIFNSCKVSFMSSGVKIVPDKTDAKKHAPNSGFDSHNIATLSPLLSLATFISQFEIFLYNSPIPL